ncbi:conserved oligomeric Golgi complex subunit 1 isoform 2-T2 [Discoglossus pictus]
MAAMKLSGLKDPGTLFEAHSAEEIRVLERQVRGEIEHKKEELRQMVGERYRDLIEAADTIWEMKKSSERVVGAVRDMEQYCGTLKGKTSLGTERGDHSTARSQEKFYSMAAQIKLLLEIPEKIWSAMEASQYLHATQLYLLCCHLHSLLQLDSSSSRYSPILARFPILIRQVAAAGNFRSTILQESKALLKCPSASDQAVAEALCSIMLLEDSSPRQALADFLLARKSGIQQLLNQPHHGSGIKAQVCSLVELLANTLYQAHALFYTQSDGAPADQMLTCGLLFSMLETVTAQQAGGKGIKVLKEEMKSVSWFKHLPSSIVDFQPALRTLAHPINQEYLQETLKQWISMCNEDIKSGISALLVYIKSLKGLAGIRDAVWELLTSESMSQNWEKVCRRLLDRPIRFWEDLLQQMFLDRLQTLTKEGFECISGNSVQLLHSSLQELEVSSEALKHLHHESNVSSFLWSESPNDLPPDAAWVSVGSRGPQHRSGLFLKAQAVTPCIQSFCAALDAKLKVRLEDLFSYLPRETPSAALQSEPLSSVGKLSAFDRYGDAVTVQEMLRHHCLACMEHIQDSINAELASASHVVLDEHNTLSGTKLSAVLFLARLCQSLGELCPHLKQCIVGKTSTSEQTIREPKSAKKAGKGKAADAPTMPCKWQDLKDKLMQQSLKAYRIWSSAIVKSIVASFTQTLLVNTPGSALATATHWDEIEIQEETEAGSSVTSKIRLPGQCSWYVQSLLFSLCQAVNHIGGHALPRVTLQELLKSCLLEVVGAYEKLCQGGLGKKQPTALTQTRALQLLFDLRYLSLLLSARSEDVKSSKSKQDSRIQKVADQLESCIDPFDLDVFTPHLNANLNRLAQRTSVLFGLLTGAENQFTSRSSSVGLQETHNVLPLASSQIRFGLLPLSMSSSRKTKSTLRMTENVKMPLLPTDVLL